MSATKHLEELMYSFLSKRLTDREKRELGSKYDVERHIDEETEEEMRWEIYQFVKDRVFWTSLLGRLHQEVADEEDTDAEEDSTDEEED
jgi:hypothetical protein